MNISLDSSPLNGSQDDNLNSSMSSEMRNGTSSSMAEGIRHYHNRTEDIGRLVHRGEVWFTELGSHYGTSVQSGCRPVIVVSNNTANEFSRVLTVIPLTTKHKKDDLPTHVTITADDLTRCDRNREFYDSMLLAEQITTISKAQLVSYLGAVTDYTKLHEIADAISCHLGL